MQLVAKGNQDVYLTGKPQITFIKSVYKRHTNFSIESIEQTLSGGQIPTFGSQLDCIIGRQGDLINKIYFKVKLPSASSVITSTNSTYKNWVNNIGHALVEDVRLLIGGTEIDKHYSEWFDIWNELTDPQQHEWDLVGKKVDPRELEENQNNSTQYLINLKFWFNKNIGLALPLIALQNHTIELKINLRELKKLILTDGTNVSVAGNITSFNIFVDYIFLDDDERRKIAQAENHEYLIEQLQYNNFNNLRNESNNIILELKHPIKELVWVFRHKDRIKNGVDNNSTSLNLSVSDINGNDWFNYCGNNINTKLGLNTYDPFTECNIELNGHDRFRLSDALYFRKLQPYNHHSNMPQKHIYTYSFCLNPEQHQPTGTCNFSVLDSKKLILKNPDLSNYELNIYAINYNIFRIEGGRGYLLFAN